MVNVSVSQGLALALGKRIQGTTCLLMMMKKKLAKISISSLRHSTAPHQRNALSESSMVQAADASFPASYFRRVLGTGLIHR